MKANKKEYLTGLAFKVCEIGSRFEGASQHHVPFVVVEFEPVPVGAQFHAKGWKDRDTFAAFFEGINHVKQ